MKSFTPEIAWHNIYSVLSIDVQYFDETQEYTSSTQNYRLATGSVDQHVIVWQCSASGSHPKLEVLADLHRHQQPVNIVRFAPLYSLLASGDNDGIIIIWKLQERSVTSTECKNEQIDSFDDYGIVNKENWVPSTFLRCHLNDVVDLQWSPDALCLISGSVDNKAAVWDVQKAKYLELIQHHSYVQGVAWDPLNQYMATLSADRNLRILNVQTKKIMYRVFKGSISYNQENHSSRLFFDDTLRSYCRRFCFSPGGEFLIASSGIVEIESTKDGEKVFINCVYLFQRNCLNKPAAYYSTGNKYNFAVSCCPVLFRLRENVTNHFPFQYRIVFAVATQDSVLFYDTQQDTAFAMVTNVHYTSLSDIKWSPDGRLLLVSSTDGYCTFIMFEENEIGIPYTGPKFELQQPNNVTTPERIKETASNHKTSTLQPGHQIGHPVRKTPESAKITSFFQKINLSSIEQLNGLKRKSVKTLDDDTPVKMRSPEEKLEMDTFKTSYYPRVLLEDFVKSETKRLTTTGITLESDIEKRASDGDLKVDENNVDSTIVNGKHSPSEEQSMNVDEVVLIASSPEKQSNANSAEIDSANSKPSTSEEKMNVDGVIPTVPVPNNNKRPRRVNFITLTSKK